MKSLFLSLILCLTVLVSMQASAQYRHPGAYPGRVYPGGYPGHVYPGYGYPGYRYPGYAYPGYAYPAYPGYIPGYGYPGYAPGFAPGYAPGFYGYPNWFNNGVVLPGWAWAPSAAAGLWQCTAVNSALQTFPQVGATIQLAANAALTSCGGLNYQAMGCFIPANYCQLR
jgi:hypothetical protein